MQFLSFLWPKIANFAAQYCKMTEKTGFFPTHQHVVVEAFRL
jgi:hypothetical protein